MAEVKISGMTAASAPDLDDQLELVEDGATRKVTISQIADTISPAWTTPSFNAGNFTASGAMTWTVASGDVVTYAYQVIGKRMTVMFHLGTTTVGGSVNTELFIAIPGGKTATKAVTNPIWLSDNGTKQIAKCSVDASGTTINISKADETNFTLATDTTAVRGEITFEIN